MMQDLKLLSLIWSQKYQSNDERDINEMIFELEGDTENGELQSLHSESVLVRQ